MLGCWVVRWFGVACWVVCWMVGFGVGGWWLGVGWGVGWLRGWWERGGEEGRRRRFSVWINVVVFLKACLLSWAGIMMKATVKCDQHCELYDSVNHLKVERMLFFRFFFF